MRWRNEYAYHYYSNAFHDDSPLDPAGFLCIDGFFAIAGFFCSGAIGSSPSPGPSGGPERFFGAAAEDERSPSTGDDIIRESEPPGGLKQTKLWLKIACVMNLTVLWLQQNTLLYVDG